MLRSRFCYLFVIVIILGIPSNVFGQNIGIFPSILDFHVAPNQSETQNINLSNSSNQKLQFRLYLNDWLRDTTGGHEYMEPNTISRSCAKWVSLSKSFVELEPGQSTQVGVKLQVPDSVKEMKWAMLFVETVQEKKDDKSKAAKTSINNIMRIGVHIYETPPGLTQKQVKVEDFKLLDPKNRIYRLICKNTGEVMLTCNAYLELASLATSKRTKVEVPEFPMFPQQTRYVDFKLPADLAKGKYSSLAVIDAGEDMAPEAAEQTIEIK